MLLDFVGGEGGVGRYGFWQEGWIGLDGEAILFPFCPRPHSPRALN